MSSFTIQLKEFEGKAENNMLSVIKKVELDLFERVIKRTPVDTGRARMNWQTSIGAMSAGTLPGPANSPAEGDTGEAGMRAAETVDSATLRDAVYLYNNLPYIGRLEDGWSKQQAPNGMVRISVREFQGIVKEAAR